MKISIGDKLLVRNEIDMLYEADVLMVSKRYVKVLGRSLGEHWVHRRRVEELVFDSPASGTLRSWLISIVVNFLNRFS